MQISLKLSVGSALHYDCRFHYLENYYHKQDIKNDKKKDCLTKSQNRP
ncbi:hypothetical protein MTBBW1_1670016 [Desulfamplus magnetovallimortis]|uniref:Uncharacterized protein n=1 Tax=Desulfamplus magnetovallimortis TaxID=1246637 RepID=A0A1W1H929_9BACT|nr:hypothetical protein MTBBW1_1670016 [Desulfamplus magnetovallimortis]